MAVVLCTKSWSKKGMTFSYEIHDVEPYINWLYFFHAWGFGHEFAAVARLHDCESCRAVWIAGFNPELRAKAREAAKLFADAKALLRKWEGEVQTHALFSLCDCKSDGDDIVLADGARIPLLRQQQNAEPPYLCLSDFINPHGGRIGIFCCTCNADTSGDEYTSLLHQTVADRLAEATAEFLHLNVRRELWAYAPDERLSVADLHRGLYQGIRPAVGYPCLPDQSLNFVLDGILGFSGIGVGLTANGAMMPHASVSGLMIEHPASRYFAIGDVGYDQLQDYAQRRGMNPDALRKFIKSCS